MSALEDGRTVSLKIKDKYNKINKYSHVHMSIANSLSLSPSGCLYFQ